MVAAAHGQLAAAADFEHVALALVENLDEPFDLAFHTGHLNDERFRGQVDDAGAKDLNQFKNLRASAWRGGYLNQRELTGDVGRLRNIVHLDHILQFIKACADAMSGFGGCFAHKSQARETGTLAAAHCE